MGTWGYMPSNGDATGDMVTIMYRDAVWPHVRKVLRKKVRVHSGQRYGRVGLVESVVNDGHEIPLDVAALCVKDLRACLEDELWIESWRSPETARKTILDLIQAFEQVPTNKRARFYLKERLAKIRRAAKRRAARAKDRS